MALTCAAGAPVQAPSLGLDHPLGLGSMAVTSLPGSPRAHAGGPSSFGTYTTASPSTGERLDEAGGAGAGGAAGGSGGRAGDLAQGQVLPELWRLRWLGPLQDEQARRSAPIELSAGGIGAGEWEAPLGACGHRARRRLSKCTQLAVCLQGACCGCVSLRTGLAQGPRSPEHSGPPGFCRRASQVNSLMHFSHPVAHVLVQVCPATGPALHRCQGVAAAACHRHGFLGLPVSWTAVGVG